MKKIILCLTAVLICGAFVSNAQNDTTFTKSRSRTDTLMQAPVPPPQVTTPARQGDQYLQEDRVLITPDQLPVHLKETLQANQYKGWENSSVYQDRVTGEYSLEITNGDASTRSYRFDKNGKLIADPSKPKDKVDEK